MRHLSATKFARAIYSAPAAAWLALQLCACGGGIPLGAGGGASSATPTAVALGPQLGYVWSAADQSLRPILGVPGSSQMGAPIAAPGAYLAGAASAASDSALLQEADGSLVAMALPGGATTRLGAGPATSSGAAAKLQIEYAPSGQYAIAYELGGSAITLVSGLPGAPQLQTLQVGAAGLLRAAVGDSGQVMAASAGGSGAAVELITPAGKSLALANVRQLGGMAFVPQQDEALLLDAAAGSLLLLRNVSANPASQSIAAPGMAAPVSVAASQDGRWAMVANSADKSVLRFDLSTGSAPLKIACSFQPNQISRLRGNAVFRLNDIGSGPAWMVDASAAAPQTLFIPAVEIGGGTSTAGR